MDWGSFVRSIFRDRKDQGNQIVRIEGEAADEFLQLRGAEEGGLMAPSTRHSQMAIGLRC